jgi:anti-sigma B factor antagonist
LITIDFSVTSRAQGDWTIVSVVGELDLSTAPALRGDLIEHLEAGHARLIVDMTDVAFMDSTGLGMLVAVLKRAKESGGSLVLSGPQRQVRRVLQITGVEDLFAVAGSVEDVAEGA